MSHEPVATQGHNSDDHSGDIIQAVATKGQNSDLPITLTSLTESGADLHKYLLISSALRGGGSHG
jgi:hypothetical protein